MTVKDVLVSVLFIITNVIKESIITWLFSLVQISTRKRIERVKTAICFGNEIARLRRCGSNICFAATKRP